MFLALTSQTEFWDHEDELLFAGEWCRRHDRPGDWKARNFRMLAEPWADPDRFRRAVAYCDEFSERLLPAFTSYLNSILSSNGSDRYWRILISRWLTFHVQHMYDHSVRVSDALKAFPGLRSVRADPALFRTPRNTSDALQLTLHDPFNLQVFSHFLPAEGGRFPVVASAENPPAKIVLRASSRGKALLKRTITRLLASLVPPGRGEILFADLNLPKEEQRRLIAGSRFKALPYLAELPQEFDFDPVFDGRRRGLSLIAEGRDDFERIFIASLPQYFPTLYLEGHLQARRYSLARLWRTPRVIFSAVGWHANEAFKFAAAECADRGSALWGLQHGGVYGQWEHADAERFERAIVDRYYCWGWSSQSGDARLKDLPHPQLSRTGTPDPGADILFVPTIIHFHNIRLSRTTSAIGQEYVEREARFLRTLSPRLQDKTCVRLFQLELGWRHEDRLRELYPRLRADDGSLSFSARLRSARLAVFDSPMTTFLEALAAGVPSVLTWDPEVWIMRAEARPYFERLRNAGILYDVPEAAARHVDSVYDDPLSWWNSEEVRSARDAFSSRFALHSADWLRAWLAEFDAPLELVLPN